MALATRYDVSTQVASSGVTERLPAICCSDTFTTVVSSTSIKVPSITEMAMIHGLMTGLEDSISLCRYAPDRCCILHDAGGLRRLLLAARRPRASRLFAVIRDKEVLANCQLLIASCQLLFANCYFVNTTGSTDMPGRN